VGDHLSGHKVSVESQLQLADYLADNYGRCRVTPCLCRERGRWLGRRCPEWVPCGARNWAEMRIEIEKFCRLLENDAKPKPT
jgi:hypothetical protein